MFTPCGPGVRPGPEQRPVPAVHPEQAVHSRQDVLLTASKVTQAGALASSPDCFRTFAEPPGLSRWRTVLPDDAGIGAGAHRCAQAAITGSCQRQVQSPPLPIHSSMEW